MVDKKLFAANRGGSTRSSNLELYRIVCMLMIVAHHFVVNSGLTAVDGPLKTAPLAANSIYLYLFGMWGKTGINCFLMITGYFMCTSKITLRKFLKLYLWIVFYRIVINGIFLATGRLEFSPSLLSVFFPFGNIHSDDFFAAFMVWWLFIPFLNVLINNIDKRLHQLLMLLLVVVFTVYPFVPEVLNIEVNPICWFSTIYVIASYIRKYPESVYKSDTARFWGLASLALVVISMISVVAILLLRNNLNGEIHQYYMVSDSNMPLALLVSVSTFMWFNNLRIPRSKLINAIGGSTFGVLLIHANSDTMRQWLWKDTIDCVGHYGLPLGSLIAYSCLSVLTIFTICTIIDRLRVKALEEPLFRLYDRRKESDDQHPQQPFNPKQ